MHSIPLGVVGESIIKKLASREHLRARAARDARPRAPSPAPAASFTTLHSNKTKRQTYPPETN